MWRSWNTTRRSAITMTRRTSGLCSPAKLFTERRQQPLALRHTSVVMPYNTSKLMRHYNCGWPQVGSTMFASQIVLWLPLLGMFTGFLNTGVALTLVASAWGILMLFNLITLPVEFDASARARLVLKQTGPIQTAEEDAAFAQVLRAAAWTYVAALITSLTYFLLHLLPLLGGCRE
jgi:Putative neutral zinc metallopeptidase